MDAEQARQQIKHHEAAALRHTGAKRQQHLEAARYLRERFGIPEPTIVKAVPPIEPADFGRLRTRLQPHVASKPEWKQNEEYRRK